MTHRVLRILGAIVFVLSCWPSAAAQTGTDYLDVYIVQVKPEKRTEFDAIAKKIAAANRNAGDQWIAMDTMYGDADTVAFVSTRPSYGDIEKAMSSFMGAMNKAYGEEAAHKLFADFASCVVSSRGELRQRRWDLSSNVPKDGASLAKMIGGARFVRTTVVHVRPGRIADFEAMVKDVKAAREKSAPSEVQLVSQAVAGNDGTVFYVTVLKPSMSAFDTVPTMQKLLGDEGYQKFLKANSDIVETTQTMIMRFNPDLSNPPSDVMAASPDFWAPKAVVAAGKKEKPKVKEGK